MIYGLLTQIFLALLFKLDYLCSVCVFSSRYHIMCPCNGFPCVYDLAVCLCVRYVYKIKHLKDHWYDFLLSLMELMWVWL